MDFNLFLPFPPPPKRMTVDEASFQLAQWVESCGGTVEHRQEPDHGS